MDQLLTMNEKELRRMAVLQKLEEKRMRQSEAASLLALSVRQVKRLLKSYRSQGAAGLVSKRRGRPSNNQLAEGTRQKVLGLLQSKYKGFGPTLACEKLVELEGLQISDESVRQLMIAETLWKPRKARKAVVHQMRERRACFGELVQIDGSPHDWFEGRAPACSLLVFIDDATGQLGHLSFVQSESFFSYSLAVSQYFGRYGKPLVFYSDKHGIFRVNQPSVGSSETLTQFGRAMQELQVQIICAHTPQAKGRVERVILTLQDRLPKELRLRNISSWEAGNAFLPEFMADFNQRFAVQPRSDLDAHRPLTPSDDLAQILTWQETRTLSKNLTLQFRKKVYQIQTPRPTYALRHATVTVCLDAQDHLAIFHKSKPLTFTLFQQQARQSDIVDTKQLNQAIPKHHKPAPDHPWRRGYPASPSEMNKTHPHLEKGDISTLEKR